MIVAALTLLVMALSHGKATVLEVIRGVDYKTLLFFIGLFVSVCGLEKTGVLDIIARFITNISGGHVATIVVIILWLSAVTSAFVDNIPFAATMIPVIRSIASARTSAATRRPSVRARTWSAPRYPPRAAIPSAGGATANTACPPRSS